MTDMESRYTPGTYLKDKAVAIALIVAVVIIMSAVYSVLQVSVDGIALADLTIVVIAGAYFIYDYRRKRAFWTPFEDVASTVDDVEYIADLIAAPSFLDGQIAHKAACDIAARASNEITDLKANIRSNREYIELWVHETKTPIAAAKLILDTMHGADAARLKRELERTENLVEQALFSARSNVVANDYLIREIPLSEIVRDACKQNMHYLTSLDVSIDIEIDPAITVFTDKTWLAFIISQVITNAAKYEATSISFTVDAPVRESASGHTLLKIQDNGCGIPAYDVPRVFDRGFTGEVGRTHGAATGMGLYLAARMCSQMGLGIALASEEGRGTRVEISFPHDRRRAAFVEGNRESYDKVR